MKSRERVIAAINFERPDRCPITHNPLPGAVLKYGKKLFNIFRRYPSDFGPSEFKVPNIKDLHPGYQKGIHKDEWGLTWRTEINGVLGQVIQHPLKDYNDLADYKFPPLPSERDIQKLKKWVRKIKSDGYFACVSFNPGNYYERMQWLRGFTNLMRDFFRKPKELYELADLLLDYILQSLAKTLEAKPDGIWFADDWGTQDRLMVNPAFWREFFKPRYKKIFNFVHDHEAYVFFHSDGYIIDIIPDLSEIGVDVLWPQFSCHNVEKLAKVTREKICIFSDIDRQYILPKGKPKEVETYVKKVINLFGYENNGGLIGNGEINVDVPLENVEAMYKAFRKYGKYNW